MACLASNLVVHARTKHIEIDIHLIHDKVLKKKFRNNIFPTEDHIVDILTKALFVPWFNMLKVILTLSLSSFHLRGHVGTHVV